MFKMIFGADLGFDNGVYDGGEYRTLDAAIEAANDELATAHQVYGAYVTDKEGKIVAESNGTWDDQIPWWHCVLD